MTTFGLLVILFSIGWIAAFGYAHKRAVDNAKAAETWPVANGRILAAHVVEETRSAGESGTTTWYNPVVHYSYPGSTGEELQGTRLRFGNCRSQSRKKAEAALAPYAVGAAASVRYNPMKPSDCVLETTPPNKLYLIMSFVGLIFLAMGFFFMSVR